MSQEFDSTAEAFAPRRFPILLRRAWYSLNQVFRRRVSRLEITPDQYTVLRWLYEHSGEGLTQRGLADLMASDPNTITSILTRMEAAGLIERRAHERDRRAKRIRLPSKGRKIFEEARLAALELQDQVLGVLTAQERDQFLEYLERVANASRKVLEEGEGKGS